MSFAASVMTQAEDGRNFVLGRAGNRLFWICIAPLCRRCVYCRLFGLPGPVCLRAALADSRSKNTKGMPLQISRQKGEIAAGSDRVES